MDGIEHGYFVLDGSAEQGKSGKYRRHCRQQKIIRTEDIQRCNGAERAYESADMLAVLAPLFNENDDEHGSHGKIQSLCVETDQRSEDRSETSSGKPVELIQSCNEEHEPSPVHIRGHLC